jgi:hypothetical protein
VSNFDHTVLAWEGSLTLGRVGAHGGCAMSKTDQFWQYAREAVLAASNAKTDEERQRLLDLGRTWTRAALLERASAVGRDGVADAHRQMLEPNALTDGCNDDRGMSYFPKIRKPQPQSPPAPAGASLSTSVVAFSPLASK